MINLLFTLVFSIFIFAVNAADYNSVHDFAMENIYGEPVKLVDYKGKVLLIVNTASKCGLTPQYEELEKLYQEYKDQGLMILGFPANNFMNQEPGTDEEILKFCKENYGVSFDMFSKISVKGKDTHPLYEYLTSKEQNGVLDTKVSWNFQKFLVDKEGKVITTFSPKTSVYDAEALSKIKKHLEE
ncbi:MAG: glutathione peroxidase [Chitinophagales bacterium]